MAIQLTLFLVTCWSNVCIACRVAMHGSVRLHSVPSANAGVDILPLLISSAQPPSASVLIRM